jgi:hypothetical protein
MAATRRHFRDDVNDQLHWYSRTGELTRESGDFYCHFRIASPLFAQIGVDILVETDFAEKCNFQYAHCSDVEKPF